MDSRKLWLAPMLGYTEHKFRNTFCRHFEGLDAAISPFVTLVKGRRVKYSHLKDLWPEHNKNIPVIPQIIGNEAEEFVMMADTLLDLGYTECNWNLGCPVWRVARKQRGSGLLPYPERIKSILDFVIPKTASSISLKIRLGYHHPDEADQLIDIFNDYPIKRLILHPRIGKQLYGGTVNLKKFRLLYPLISLPLMYNGDIFEKADLENLHNEFPQIKDFMIGRGIFLNPFLAEEIKGVKNQKSRQQRFLDFHNDLMHIMQEGAKRESNFLNKMKEYWQYFRFMYPDASEIRELFRCNEPENFSKTAQHIILKSEPDCRKPENFNDTNTH